MFQATRAALMTALLLLAAAPGTSHAVAIFTSLDAMIAAAGAAPTQIETFNSPANRFGARRVTFPGTGVTSTITAGGTGFAAIDNRVASGRYKASLVGSGNSTARRITWDLGSSLFGFGAEFSQPGFPELNRAVEISVDGGATYASLRGLIGGHTGFLGFLSTDPAFTTVNFRSNSSDYLDGTFLADNLVLFGNIAPVPAPAPFALFCLALSVLRSRRAIAQSARSRWLAT